MAEVRFENVTKKFDTVVAVDNLNLEIPDKEFLVLVGPSGCGKSTVLRLLSGLEELTEGKIFIGGKLVNNVAPKDRDIAMVFQSYALYPHMSVYDNMAFGLKLKGVSKQEIDQRVKEGARLLGITELLKRKPRQLSGGQRQRVALGRAIVRKPAVFLLDEPLSNLDAKLRVQTRAEISKLHQRLGTTFIYVTHDQIEAMTMASRIAVLDKGVLQQVGTPRELYERPENIFVAGFIGSPAMNFFQATPIQEKGGVYLESPIFQLPVPAKKAIALIPHIGEKIIFGIRPEDIFPAEFLPSGRDASANLTAKVDVTEMLGNELFMYLVVGPESQTFLARVDPRTNVNPGENVEIIFNMENMHAFNPKTGKVLREEH
jgi:multiple sugar transport system ATP-binding protein